MLARTPLELGLLVRSRRRELGLTQQQLADKAGVSRLWVRWLERGKASIELGLAMRTLLALRLDVEVSPSPPPKDDELDINAVVERSTGMP